MNRSEFALFECHGSEDKDLAATAVVRAISKAHPDRKIVIISRNPHIWLHNPRVYRVYTAGSTPYFYEDYIRERDTLIFRLDPYETDDFLHGRGHLTEIWCRLCGVPWDGPAPELTLTRREDEIGKTIVSRLTEGRPSALFSISDGPAGWPYQSRWRRTMPMVVAQKTADLMRERGYAILQIRRDDDPAIVGAARLTMSNARHYAAALAHVSRRLLVDGAIQGMAAALGLPSTVLWIGTDQEVTGYPLHSAITARISDAFREHAEDHPEYASTADQPFPFIKEWRSSFTPVDIVDTLDTPHIRP